MRRNAAGHLCLLVPGRALPRDNQATRQSESSHAINSTSRFQRGGLEDLAAPSTFSRALRLASTLALA